MDNSNWVLSTRSQSVLELVINRPERKNALNMAMYTELAEQLRQAAEDAAVRVVVITGAGGCFTSGNDLEDFARGADLHPASSPITRFMQALLQFPKPVIAAVDGVAIGIGTTLLLHCDLAYASPASQFRMPFVQLGLCPEYASSLLVPRLVGHLKASEWLLLGNAFSAAEAEQGGIINKVAEDPLQVARASAAQLVAMAPAALRATKALLRAPLREQTDEVLNKEFQMFGERLRGPEFAEAAAAFFSKRAPDFSRFE
ncbi:MAG: enoyl-CoA hydratase [Cellvibrionaceae bacterium]|nr:enoyl-CoA hydratase [Cellvibrionaceae bacterium]